MIHPSLLNNISLFSGVDLKTKEFWAQKMVLINLPKKSFLVHSGDTSTELYFLISGKLKVIDYTADGREIELATISPGMHLGELSVIDNQPRSASVLAFENCQIAMMPQTDAKKMFSEVPLIAERIMQRLAEMIRSDNVFRTTVTVPSAPKRIIWYLLNSAKKTENGDYVIENLPQQKYLAAMMNTSRESVSRVLSQLTKNKVLEKGGQLYVIHRIKDLKEMAEKE